MTNIKITTDWQNQQYRHIDPYSPIDSDNHNKLLKVLGGSKAYIAGFDLEEYFPRNIGTNTIYCVVKPGICVIDYVVLDFHKTSTIELFSCPITPRTIYVVVEYMYSKVQPSPFAVIKSINMEAYHPERHLKLYSLYVEKWNSLPNENEWRIWISNPNYLQNTKSTSETVPEWARRAFILRTGDNMEGNLKLFKDPEDSLDATSKRYVDRLIYGVESHYVKKAGDEMLGSLHLPDVMPEEETEAVHKKYVDKEIENLHKYLKKITKYITPQEFGAQGNLLVEDTTAFNEALSFVERNPEYVLYIPGGDYLVRSLNPILNSNVHIYASDTATLHFNPHYMTDTLFRIRPKQDEKNTFIQDISINNLTVTMYQNPVDTDNNLLTHHHLGKELQHYNTFLEDTITTHMGNTAFHVSNTYNLIFNNVKIIKNMRKRVNNKYSCFQRGILLEGYNDLNFINNTSIIDCLIDGCNINNIEFRGLVKDTHIKNTRSINCKPSHFNDLAVDDIYKENCCGLKVLPFNGYSAKEIYLTKNKFNNNYTAIDLIHVDNVYAKEITAKYNISSCLLLDHCNYINFKDSHFLGTYDDLRWLVKPNIVIQHSKNIFLNDCRNQDAYYDGIAILHSNHVKLKHIVSNGHGLAFNDPTTSHISLYNCDTVDIQECNFQHSNLEDGTPIKTAYTISVYDNLRKIKPYEDEDYSHLPDPPIIETKNLIIDNNKIEHYYVDDYNEVNYPVFNFGDPYVHPIADYNIPKNLIIKNNNGLKTPKELSMLFSIIKIDGDVLYKIRPSNIFTKHIKHTCVETRPGFFENIVNAVDLDVLEFGDLGVCKMTPINNYRFLFECGGLQILGCHVKNCMVVKNTTNQVINPICQIEKASDVKIHGIIVYGYRLFLHLYKQDNTPYVIDTAFATLPDNTEITILIDGLFV